MVAMSYPLAASAKSAAPTSGANVQPILANKSSILVSLRYCVIVIGSIARSANAGGLTRSLAGTSSP